jgi:hypothetical protein
MKVTIYDEIGRPIGIAWHENNYGTVTFPVATKPTLVTGFTVNDGPLVPVYPAVLMPVDADFEMRVFDPDDDKGRAGQIRRRRATRWDKFKRLMMGDW